MYILLKGRVSVYVNSLPIQQQLSSSSLLSKGKEQDKTREAEDITRNKQTGNTSKRDTSGDPAKKVTKSRDTPQPTKVLDRSKLGKHVTTLGKMYKQQLTIY